MTKRARRNRHHTFAQSAPEFTTSEFKIQPCPEEPNGGCETKDAQFVQGISYRQRALEYCAGFVCGAAKETNRGKGRTAYSSRTSQCIQPKFPPTVPKVNSKWDGPPELAKLKEGWDCRRKTGSTNPSIRRSRPQRTYFGWVHGSGSSSKSGSSRAFRSPSPNAAASLSGPQVPREAAIPQNTGITPVDKPDGSLANSTVRQGPTHPKSIALIKSPSMTTLPEISYFFPPEGHQKSNITQVMESSKQGSHVARNTKDMLLEPRLASPANRAIAPPTPPGSSARNRPPPLALKKNVDEPAIWTPPLSQTPTNVVKPSSARKSCGPPKGFGGHGDVDVGFLAGEAQEFKLPDEEGYGYSPPASPPAMAEFPPDSPPFVRPRSATRLPLSLASPRMSNALRLSNVSLSSSITALERPSAEFTPLHAISAEEWQLRTLPEDDAISISASVADPVVPSVISEVWKQNPRERLSLGARITKTEGLPWETSPNNRNGDFDLARVPMSLDKKWKGRLLRFAN